MSADAPADQQEEERHGLAPSSASSREDEHENTHHQQTAGPADDTSSPAPSPADQGQTNRPFVGGLIHGSLRGIAAIRVVQGT